MGLTTFTECRWKPMDIHMPHYGKSGYRWMERDTSTKALTIDYVSLFFLVPFQINWAVIDYHFQW